MQARVIGDSHTFGEYLLLPNLTRHEHEPDKVQLDTPMSRFTVGQDAELRIDIPLASAMMQSVTDDRLAIALGAAGGLGFVFASQDPEDQADMVRAVKAWRPTPGRRAATRGRGDTPLTAGAALNSRDYRQRAPALVTAGADVLCVDSSDGYSEWVGEVIEFVKTNFGEQVKIGGGNVVCGDGFRYLAEAGADFVKIGIGGGAVALTREHKGVGCGQATAVLAVGAERDRYLAETGTYVPLCSDGGIVQDHHIAVALAMGADFVMMGRYFARFDESPGKIIRFHLNYAKEYWGEGTSRAGRRRGHGADLLFEEGVDAYVPYAGPLADNVQSTVAKLRSVLSMCGSLTLDQFRSSARLVLVSATALREGSAHDVILKRTDTIG